jgi:hypothetical protein
MFRLPRLLLILHIDTYALTVFNIFAATLHTAGRPSIRNLRTRHVVVTETHLPRNTKHCGTKFIQLGD